MLQFLTSWRLMPLGLLALSAFFATQFAGEATSLHAQKLSGHEFKFAHLSVEQGLSQCTVVAILQDSRGFMWFGTADGLNRYDGYNFKHYKHVPGDSNSLSHNNVVAITEDRSGMLWFGTEAGLNRFDRRQNRFVRYLHQRDDHQSLSHNHIDAIYEDHRRRLWVGTHSGLNAFDPKTQKFIRYFHDPNEPNSLGHDAVKTIYEDRAKNLWIVTSAGLDLFDRQANTFQHLVVIPNFEDAINTIYEDHAGALWLGMVLSGLKAFDRQTKTFTQHYQYDPNDSTSLSANEIYAINEDASGALWIATKHGVDRFDRATKKFLRFQHDPQNPTSINLGVCSRLYKDRSGLLWIETDGSGLNKLDPRPPKFTNIKHEPGNPNTLSKDLPKAFCEDRFGDLWIGMVWGALDRLDRRTGKFTHYRHDPNNPYSLSGDGIFAVYEDRSGDLWIGGRGLNRFDRERDRFDNYRNDAGKRLGLTRDFISVIGEDGAGNLWLGADILRKYDKRARSVISYTQADHPKQINVIYEDRQGRLWIGTNHGLHQFHHGKETFSRYAYDPANSNSLGHNYIKTIFEDRAGDLWIGTTDGLNKFNPKTETFSRYHEKDGLPNAFIYGILGDERGNLWMSTNRGLSQFNPATEKFRNYDLKDGLQSYEFNTGAYHRSKITGEMFFGGINGLNIFHPDSVLDDAYLPPVVLTDFKKFDLPVQLEADIADLDAIKLDYEEDVFSFEFAALDYTHPEKNQYGYMLEGFDHDWVHCGTRRFARYTNLDPGEYTFRVKGTNHDGVWNEQGTSIKITIVPPIWMTGWFRAFAMIVVLGAVASAAKYISVRKYKKKVEELERRQALENERKRISQDIHDELGASLTKIAILSELAKNENGHSSALQANLEKIAETARATIDSMSEIIWAINPQNNTLDNLSAYLRKCAAVFETTPMHCHLDFPETVAAHPISAEFRRHIFMVVKEAMHNVVKHAKATKVEMKFISYDHTLEVLVKDNGQGFAPETLKKSGNGLLNMSKRMEEVGGKLEIESQPQQGTTIRISAKIK